MIEVNNKTAVQLRTLIVTAVGASVPVWDVAFWLGVHDTIFYSKLFTLWISASAILLVALFVPRSDRFLNRWGMLALASPTIWFVVNALTPTVEFTWFDGLVWVMALAVFVVTIPYILYILFQLVETDALSLTPAYRNRLIAVVLIVAIAGTFVGSNHQFFVSCEQFNLAGDAAPENCNKWE